MPDLLLYMKPACPYCRKVLDFAQARGLDLPLLDIDADPAARQVLRERGGKVQVPCLFIGDKPLYESADIIAWLDKDLR